MADAKTTGKHGIAFGCSTPRDRCTGSLVDAGPGGKQFKCHSQPEEVIRCQGRYLLSLGYTKISKREFASPADNRVLVLSKKGSPIRRGKQGRLMSDFSKGAIRTF